MRRLLRLLVIFVFVASAYLAWRLNDRPSLESEAWLAAGERTGREVAVTFLGVSSLVIDDGETVLITDGFATRPPLWRVALTRIEPDPAAVDRMLERAGVERAAAVFVLHSHYDHAMDAPLVAERTGAVLVGSESTANVARGLSFPQERLRVVAPGESLRFGAFEVTLLEGRHFPHGMAMGEITEPLVPPVRADAYREGGSYSLLVSHPLGTLLVDGSAGWTPGEHFGRRADVALLGVAGLGTLETSYTEDYLRETAVAVGAKLVIPIHWDDFTQPLTEPLVPLPRLIDDVALTLERIKAYVATHEMRMALLPAFERVRLLPPAPPSDADA